MACVPSGRHHWSRLRAELVVSVLILPALAVSALKCAVLGTTTDRTEVEFVWERTVVKTERLSAKS